MNPNILEQKNKKFFKKISKIYDKRIFGKSIFDSVKKAVEIADIKKKSKILDIGCGTGSLLFFLSKDNSLELHGFDLSEEMLKIAGEKLKDKTNLKLISVRKFKEEYKKNYFDYIFISDAFHHFPYQEKVIEDSKILLKSGGKLVINDFSFGKIGNKLFHWIDPGNSGMHTLKEYKKLFEKNKFKNIKQKKIGLIAVYTEGIK